MTTDQRVARESHLTISLVLTAAEAAAISTGLKYLERIVTRPASKAFVRNLRALIDDARGQTVKQAKIIHRGDD